MDLFSLQLRMLKGDENNNANANKYLWATLNTWLNFIYCWPLQYFLQFLEAMVCVKLKCICI